MSGITTGIGLISGINTAQLIDQLMAIEARPLQTLQARVKALDTRRAAYLDLSAQLLAIRNAVTNFNQTSFFQRFSATSSNPELVAATASAQAVPGTATLRVHSLVTSHAFVSRGFADSDRTPVGLGTITIESAMARLDRGTELSALNGGRGVRRGIVRITDRAGNSADIDLRRAFTVDDVLDAINNNGTARVRATVTGLEANGASGERLVLTDESGGAGNLSVVDLAGGSAARDLGIAGSVGAARLDGAELMRLDVTTALSELNDGNGVDRFRQGATTGDLIFNTASGGFEVALTDVLAPATDLRGVNSGNGVRLGVVRITDRTGASAEVDLRSATTVQDVLTAIEATGLAISATTVNSRLQITSTAPATLVDPKNLEIEDVSGHAAEDLGIAADVSAAAVSGREIYRVNSIGDVIRAINYAEGNNGQVTASLSADGKRLELQASTEAGTVTVAAGQDAATGFISQAARDLGIADGRFSAGEALTSRRLLGGLNTTLLQSLRGGAGVTAGIVSFTDRSGATAAVDFAAAETLQDVVDLINGASGISLHAEVNDVGNGIVIRDTSGGSGAIAIEDQSGSLANDLEITTAEAAEVTGGNLQKQYISRRTLLSGLNGGKGVGTGTFTITSTTGGTHTINVNASMQTVGELIDAINHTTPDHLHARINDQGDGIYVVDTGGGDTEFSIADTSGKVASGLRLAAGAGANNFIDGSFEATVEVSASDTLSRIAAKLNAANAGFKASVINDGGSVNPFSLTVTSAHSGRRGELLIGASGMDLAFGVLTQAQDALVSVGTAGSASMLVNSASNTLKDVLPGVSIDLLNAADEDVTITTEQDMDAIVQSVKTFVETYNALQSKLSQYSSFNSETQERGTLFGDSTVDQVRRRVQRVLSQPYALSEETTRRLFTVGLDATPRTADQLGQNQLRFDEEKFREAYAADPAAVEALFTTAEAGFGAVLQSTLDELSRSGDGLLARRGDAITDQQELLNSRISQMNTTLEAKRSRLEAQFVALERTLAAMQDQQNALTSLAQLAANARG